MSTREIIRAWKDPEYRSTLSGEARALLPEHPAGWMEPADAVLQGLPVRTGLRAGWGNEVSMDDWCSWCAW